MKAGRRRMYISSGVLVLGLAIKHRFFGGQACWAIVSSSTWLALALLPRTTTTAAAVAAADDPTLNAAAASAVLALLVAAADGLLPSPHPPPRPPAAHRPPTPAPAVGSKSALGCSLPVCTVRSYETPPSGKRRGRKSFGLAPATARRRDWPGRKR